MKEPILCYVKDSWAYFTTQDLKDQWGDDWNDAPYEHNAGEPYEPTIFHRKDGPEKCPKDHHPDGTPKWTITKVAWSGDFEKPCYSHWNSPHSVEDINAGAVPWLFHRGWKNDPSVAIPAGTTLSEFIRLVKQVGGEVYLPLGETAPALGGNRA